MNLYDEITVLLWKEAHWMTAKQIAHRTCTDLDTVDKHLDVLEQSGRFRRLNRRDGLVLWGCCERPPAPRDLIL